MRAPHTVTSEESLDLAIAAQNSLENQRAKRLTKKRTKKGAQRKHPTTSEMDYSVNEVEFLMAIHSYQFRTGRRFLDPVEVLSVLRSLGYEKKAEILPYAVHGA